jgi:hypothetical protein
VYFSIFVLLPKTPVCFLPFISFSIATNRAVVIDYFKKQENELLTQINTDKMKRAMPLKIAQPASPANERKNPCKSV